MVRPDYRSQDGSAASVDNAGTVAIWLGLNGRVERQIRHLRR